MVTLHDDRQRRRRYPERTLEIMQHGLRAPDQPPGSARRAPLEHPRPEHGHLGQLDRLPETGAEQAVVARGVPRKELRLGLLQSVLVVGGEPPVQIGQESADVECRVGEGAAVEVDQRERATGDQQVFAFEVAVRKGRRLLGNPLVQVPGAVEDPLDRRTHRRQQRRNVSDLPLDLLHLRRKVQHPQRAGRSRGQVVQGLEVIDKIRAGVAAQL